MYFFLETIQLYGCRSGVGRELALTSISALPGKYHEASKSKGFTVMTGHGIS